ncbi:MAG: BlaI/MecI/CopY family transcriptional regulator, partial [Planctomycetota bacterium]
MVKRRLPAVSPAETEILRIVWQAGKATVQQVVSRLPA